jgi:hypothetical protein
MDERFIGDMFLEVGRDFSTFVKKYESERDIELSKDCLVQNGL